MPELPEVETIKRQLAPLVEGRTLERVKVLDERWCRPLAPGEMTDALEGRKVEKLGRRGKYLLWGLSEEVYLAQHLRMTGTVLCDPIPSRHTYACGSSWTMGQGYIVDPRRFGTGELLLGDEALEEFFAARLGMEPLDERFSAEHLRMLARGRTAPIKAFCSTSAVWQASATSMQTRPCTGGNSSAPTGGPPERRSVRAAA